MTSVLLLSRGQRGMIIDGVPTILLSVVPDTTSKACLVAR